MLAAVQATVKRLIPSGSVLDRGAKSGVWVGGIKVSNRLLQLLLLVILARLLTPRDFGLMGIALLTLGATQQLSQIGLDAALIQQREDDIDRYLDWGVGRDFRLLYRNIAT